MNFVRLILPFQDTTAISVIGLFAIFSAYAIVRGLLLQGAAFFFVQSSFAKDKRVYRLPFSAGQIIKELRGNLVAVVVESAFFAVVLKTGIFSESHGHFFLSFAITFVWWEIWFYGYHRALHSRPLYFLHRHHHIAKVNTPLAAASFSIGEAVFLVIGGFGPVALLSHVLPISAEGVALYVLVNFVLTIFIHLNTEIMPPAFLKIPVLNWLNPPTHHSLHHARYKGHFSLYTPFMDWIFGSEFADYGQVQKRAYEGRGLTAFSERIPVKGPAPGIVVSLTKTNKNASWHDEIQKGPKTTYCA